jgi:toxin ParE1/3/4
MARVLTKPEAETVLLDIWLYIAQDSPNNADHFLDRVREKFWRLAESPHIGSNRDLLKEGLRSHPIGSYLIFYFPLTDGIEIVRVLHGARDIESLFLP